METRTLHSLGVGLIRRAETQGLLPARTRPPQSRLHPSTLARRLAEQALAELARRRDLDAASLDIDRDELVDQIAAWKQNLVYADLDGAALPASARESATQVEHDNADFVALYRIFEDLRRRQHGITFADMLRDGWEMLHRFPSLHRRAQAAYDHVLVDEFQDVSRVQAQMLDLLTQPIADDAPRNYMVIGDDDQCIYEWRGASPSFLLTFADRYNAEAYRLTDTFRSPAAHVGLANAVIACNDERRAKRLHLTQGFDGAVRLTGRDGPHAEAEALAERIQSLHKDGHAFGKMVVLVRSYAQTPLLESSLINRDVPHRIVGSVPFYHRQRPMAGARNASSGLSG